MIDDCCEDPDSCVCELDDEEDDNGPDEPDPDYEHARRWDDGEGR